MPRQRPTLIVPILLGVGAGLLLIIGALAGFPPSSGPVLLGSRLYEMETVELFGDSPPSTFTFQGVTFEFHLWCALSIDVGTICGTASAPGQPTYSYTFTDGLPEFPTPWQTWIAPNGQEAVEYHQGGQARLMVAL